jgi:hypothetical protein
MRTAEAANWKPHEDKLLYSLISDAISKGKTPGEAYQHASDFFDHMPTFTNREPNACRQRWGKIKNNESLKESITIDPDVPVTTGVQQEINFESGVLMDTQFRPEYFPVQDEQMFVPEKPSVSLPVSKEQEKPLTDLQEGPFHAIRQQLDALQNIVKNLQFENNRLHGENAELREKNERLNKSYVEHLKELELLDDIKTILNKGA